MNVAPTANKMIDIWTSLPARAMAPSESPNNIVFRQPLMPVTDETLGSVTVGILGQNRDEAHLFLPQAGGDRLQLNLMMPTAEGGNSYHFTSDSINAENEGFITETIYENGEVVDENIIELDATQTEALVSSFTVTPPESGAPDLILPPQPEPTEPMFQTQLNDWLAEQQGQ